MSRTTKTTLIALVHAAAAVACVVLILTFCIIGFACGTTMTPAKSDAKRSTNEVRANEMRSSYLKITVGGTPCSESLPSPSPSPSHPTR